MPHIDFGRLLLTKYSVTENTAYSDLGSPLFADNQGRIYVGLWHGVDGLDPSTGIVTHYGPADGARGGPIWTICADKTGAIWIASKTSVVRMLPDSKTVKLSIVEDRREIRDGLAMLIDGTEGFACCGSYTRFRAERYRTARNERHRRHPDPERALSAAGHPHAERYDDDERIFAALCAGACGYLLKKTPPARLLEALGEAAAGGGPMSPEVASQW